MGGNSNRRTAEVSPYITTADHDLVRSTAQLLLSLPEEKRAAAVTRMLHGFDLLELNGDDLRALPLEQRKANLAELLAPACRRGFLAHAAPPAGQSRQARPCLH